MKLYIMLTILSSVASAKTLNAKENSNVTEEIYGSSKLTKTVFQYFSVIEQFVHSVIDKDETETPSIELYNKTPNSLNNTDKIDEGDSNDDGSSVVVPDELNNDCTDKNETIEGNSIQGEIIDRKDKKPSRNDDIDNDIDRNKEPEPIPQELRVDDDSEHVLHENVATLEIEHHNMTDRHSKKIDNLDVNLNKNSDDNNIENLEVSHNVDDDDDGERPVCFDAIDPQDPIGEAPPVEQGSTQVGQNFTNNKDVDDDDGTRPVSFEEFKPEETIPEPPPVEHGSTQAGLNCAHNKSGGCVYDDDDDGGRPVSFEEFKVEEPIPEPPPVEHGSTQEGLNTINKQTDKPKDHKQHDNTRKITTEVSTTEVSTTEGSTAGVSSTEASIEGVCTIGVSTAGVSTTEVSTAGVSSGGASTTGVSTAGISTAGVYTAEASTSGTSTSEVSTTDSYDTFLSSYDKKLNEKKRKDVLPDVKTA